MTLILGAGAIAVDLSALERQGQLLQNSVDAAAVAGAMVWGSTGDPVATELIVNDIIRQNGIEVGDDIELAITYPSSTEVRVELIDTEPQVLLAGLVGLAPGLIRDATAQHLSCEVGCLREVPIPEPVRPILTEGSGDGFIPIVAPGRLYAVNHHGSTIECVDTEAEAVCWPTRDLSPDSLTTMNVIHPQLIGDRIYYLAWNGTTGSLPFGDGYLRLGCWNITSDSACASYAELRNVGHGTMYATDDEIYVFAADRDVYCFVPVTFAECPGYAGGLNTALTGESGWGAWDENRAWNGDRIAYDDKVYVTLSNRGAVYLHCWDLAAVAPCSSFGVHLLHDTRPGTNGDFINGRLFLHRDSAGLPTAVCSVGIAPSVECFDFVNGDHDTAAESALTATTSTMASTTSSFMGRVSYHEPTNSAYFVSTYADSTTYCYSFADGGPCDQHYTDSPFGPTQTYGYESIDNCLVGLGHASVFFTLEPDLSGPCKTVTTSFDIEPCACAGGSVWPSIWIGDSEGVSAFNLRIVQPDGAFVLPEDGSWLEFVDGDELDLSGLDLDDPFLTVEVEVVGEDDPWIDGVPPSLIVGRFSGDPVLVE